MRFSCGILVWFSWLVLRCEHSPVHVRHMLDHWPTSLLRCDVWASRCPLLAVALATSKTSCLSSWWVCIFWIGEATSQISEAMVALLFIWLSMWWQHTALPEGGARFNLWFSISSFSSEANGTNFEVTANIVCVCCSEAVIQERRGALSKSHRTHFIMPFSTGRFFPFTKLSTIKNRREISPTVTAF